MNNNNNLKDFFKKNGFSVAICSTIAILLVATLYFSYTGFQSSEENNIVKDDRNTGFEAVNKSDVKSYKEKTTQKETIENSKQTENSSEKVTETTTNLKQSKDENKENTPDKSSDDTKTEKESSQTNSSEQANNFNMFDDSQEMTWPVSGQILMDFSTETSIYDKTLELFRTNDSIAISSPAGTDVMAASEGIVENIFTDNEKGKTVVINHGNGWMSTYSQLQDEVNVAVGQVVKEGEFIAKVGNPSKYSVLLGPHLDFKITKDNVSSDPKLVLAQIEE